mmetsp:Transcript_10373/g.26722  ORF Transcript_10373/g.26722 Transcript_10373/m.26722 type:complete len:249 (+) Transcript_10373:88-834(+)
MQDGANSRTSIHTAQQVAEVVSAENWCDGSMRDRHNDETAVGGNDAQALHGQAVPWYRGIAFDPVHLKCTRLGMRDGSDARLHRQHLAHGAQADGEPSAHERRSVRTQRGGNHAKAEQVEWHEHRRLELHRAAKSFVPCVIAVAQGTGDVEPAELRVGGRQEGHGEEVGTICQRSVETEVRRRLLAHRSHAGFVPSIAVTHMALEGRQPCCTNKAAKEETNGPHGCDVGDIWHRGAGNDLTDQIGAAS